MNKIRACGFNVSHLSMIYAGFKRVGQWWNYKQVMSPFFRLYYVERGRAQVCVNDRVYELTPGTLFLIPKFTLHSYSCDDSMDHYYICFFDDNAVGTLLVEPLALQLQVDAQPGDFALILRYLELNPHRSLPVVAPNSYDNNQTIYDLADSIALSDLGALMESSGILLQLFSRFVTLAGSPQEVGGVETAHTPLRMVVAYIHKNLNQPLTVAYLAKLMCRTPDHFSKIFKRIMGVSPCYYIQIKRIERAQVLLLSSDLSMMQIAECIGVLNHAQFTRLFAKQTGCSPKAFRARQRCLVASKDQLFDEDSTVSERLAPESHQTGLVGN